MAQAVAEQPFELVYKIEDGEDSGENEHVFNMTTVVNKNQRSYTRTMKLSAQIDPMIN